MHARRVPHVPVFLSSCALALLVLSSPARAQEPSLYTDGLMGDLSNEFETGMFRTSYAVADFNRDGYQDLVVGVPHALQGRGLVYVIYGEQGVALDFDNAVVFRQGLDAHPLSAPSDDEPGDLFGYALAVGDFDGDGYTDLAIGAPGEDTRVEDAGCVFVAHGHKGIEGLSFERPGFPYCPHTDGDPSGDITWLQSGSTQTGSLHGWSLTAADFDDDGYTDLAVGAPGMTLADKNEQPVPGAGMVRILAGGLKSLTLAGQHRNAVFQIDGGEVWPYHAPGMVQKGAYVGFALESGDFDGDDVQDLVVGMPGYDVAGSSNAGAFALLQGSAEGVDGRSWPKMFHQAHPAHSTYRVPGWINGPGDVLGFSFARGDFNGDGYDDLAVGSPGMVEEGIQSGGDYFVGYGFGGGLNMWAHQSAFHQDGFRWDLHPFLVQGFSLDHPGRPQSDATFAVSLHAADLDADGVDDLIVGAPGYDTAGQAHSGAVYIKRGDRVLGLATDTRIHYVQTPGADPGELFVPDAMTDLPGKSEAGDLLGMTVAAGTFGVALAPPGVRQPMDLVLSVPTEVVDTPTGPSPTGGYTIIVPAQEQLPFNPQLMDLLPDAQDAYALWTEVF